MAQFVDTTSWFAFARFSINLSVLIIREEFEEPVCCLLKIQKSEQLPDDFITISWMRITEGSRQLHPMVFLLAGGWRGRGVTAAVLAPD